MSRSAVVLAVTASAVASSTFQATKENQTIIIQVVGMDSTNKAYLQMWDIVSLSFKDVYWNGARVYADINANTITVSGCMKYRINKDATTATVGVGVVSFDDMNII